jgi:dTDP-glucose 4,6-dehydratase
MDKSFLITGGCGFVGSNFISHLSKAYPSSKIYNIDKIDYCSDQKANFDLKNYHLVYGNICDDKLVYDTLVRYNISYVVHFAAQSHVDNSFGNSISFSVDNVVGTHTLLECCRKYNQITRFIHISTDEVYGEVDIEHNGCCEKSLLNPTNPYAATKASAEFLCKSYYHSYELPIIIIRGNNVYGPAQFPEKLIPKFTMQLLRKEKCTIHGEGKTRRNFIHVNDVSRAITCVLEKGQVNDIYNIGSKNEFTVMQIFHKICEIVSPTISPETLYEPVEDRCFNDFRYSIDTSKLLELGWSENHVFDDELKKVILHYTENFDFYNAKFNFGTLVEDVCSVRKNTQIH